MSDLDHVLIHYLWGKKTGSVFRKLISAHNNGHFYFDRATTHFLLMFSEATESSGHK